MKHSKQHPAQQDKVQGLGAALARFALNKPVTIGMLFFSMLLFGLVSSRLLPLEKFPGIDIPEMAVSYTHLTLPTIYSV